MRVLFINDFSGDPGWVNPNWGARAAVVPLKLMIEQVGGSIAASIPEDDLDRSSLGRDALRPAPEDSRAAYMARLFVPPVLPKAWRRLARRVGGADQSRFIPRTWAEYNRCAGAVMGTDTPWPRMLERFADVDVAVIHGDGDIQRNSIVARTLLFLGFLLKERYGKYVVLVNHTADLRHPELRRVAENVYPLLDDVVCRDQDSLLVCSSFCAARFAADTAFWFEPAPRAAWSSLASRPTYFDVWPNSGGFDPAKPYLCVDGSSILSTAWDPPAMGHDFARLIHHLRAAYSGQIVLTASDISEERLFGPLAKQLALPLIGLTTPVQQAVDVLGNADAYIGGRWHPAIFALRGGAPMIPLSAKTFKMRALADMAGLPTEVFDALNLASGASEIGHRLVELLEQGDSLRSRLRAWGATMAGSSWENVGFLRRWDERARKLS
jgi:hypothetical protein